MAISRSAGLKTVTEFKRFLAEPENADRLFELIDGEIVEKGPTEEHSLIAGNIYAALRTFVQVHKSGRVAFEVRRQMPDDEHNALLPDVEFTSAERALPVVRKGAVPQMPDLAVEIKSPDDSYIALREKAIYYLKNGSQLVWLVYPGKQQVEIHTSESVRTVGSDAVIDGDPVLPDFRLPVNDIFSI